MTTFYLLSGEFGASLQSTQNGKRLTKEKNCVLSYSQILYNGSINCLNCHYKHLSGANEIGRYHVQAKSMQISWSYYEKIFV